MKKLFRRACLAVSLLFLAGSSAVASHFQGGEITYTCVAPNTYQVNLSLYSDCSGPVGSSVASLNLRAGSCNAGRSVLLNYLGETYGDPYCSTIGNFCSTSRANHRRSIYSGTITFSPAEATCPDWVISSTNSARAGMANLVNPQGDIYTEATLKLSARNNSAVINPIAPEVEFVCVGKDSRVSLNASDPDCDSLSYELVAPMSAAGVPYQYSAIPVSSTNFFINPNPPAPYCYTCTPPNPQMGMYQSLPANYSPNFPFLSVNGNWNAVNPATGIPYQTVMVSSYFNLNAATGELSFRPGQYKTSTPVSGDNRYNVTIKISEWRKRNGVITKVGTVLRDMLFIVEDCSTNLNPEITNITANGQQIQPGSIVTVQAGAQLNIQLTTSDQPGDVLTLDTDAPTVLPGATFNQSSAAFPTGTISWVAPAGNPTCGVRYFYVRVKDDACPIKGKKAYVFGVRVSNAGTVMGLKEAGNNLHFSAYPNPYSDRVSFRLDGSANSGNAQILIYNSLGQEIDRLTVAAGTSEVDWLQSNRFPAGTYVARLLSENKASHTIKFIRLR